MLLSKISNKIRRLFNPKPFYENKKLPNPSDKWICYSDNFEDVILNRCFPEIGSYIDIGANDPIGGSLTKHFYDKGWSGINIEPVPSMFQKLQIDRPRDININLAIGSQSGELIFFESQISGYSTTDPMVAKKLKDKGLEINSYEIPVRPLYEICQEHNIKEVSFLKIDVEGAEKEVLEGIDFRKIKAQIIIIEATLPDSPIPCHQQWEHLIPQDLYKFSYFDGLNRWYISKQNLELEEHFKIPPCVWDHFIHYKDWKNQCELNRIFN